MGSPDPSGTRAAAHRHDGVDRVQAATFPSRSEMLPQNEASKRPNADITYGGGYMLRLNSTDGESNK
ncbi:hypothetical protein MRS44_003290 [Fusarium solani]|uniref:uncharacterized protein n=1 Tax=Fusarium solani TaxID=169388 RepID=UPI00231824C5|nr:hypothetical protein MRS44_003290 [Fusarium solani]KAJ4229929.1 hypothetical protein NW759_003295 [Fusarium solani]